MGSLLRLGGTIPPSDGQIFHVIGLCDALVSCDYSGVRPPASSPNGPKSCGAPSSASAVRPRAPTGARVLVVDDNDVVRDLLERMLRELGYDVVSVPSGEDAVALFPALRTAINVVMLDMYMPGLDGAATFRALRAIDPTTRVVICSGEVNREQVQGLIDDGACGFVSKPFNVATVAEAIAEALASPAREAPRATPVRYR